MLALAEHLSSTAFENARVPMQLAEVVAEPHQDTRFSADSLSRIAK